MPREDLREVATILRSHMERFDGAGFPDAAVGLAISLGACEIAMLSNQLEAGMVLAHDLVSRDGKSSCERACAARAQGAASFAPGACAPPSAAAT